MVRMSSKHELAGRLAFVYVGVLVLAVCIVAKALHVQIWEGETWRKKARGVSREDFVVAPNRGDICAADGRVLATSVPYYRFRFDCRGVPEGTFRRKVDSLALCLSHFFGDASKADYRKKLWNGKFGKRPNAYLAVNQRWLSYSEQKRLLTLPIFKNDTLRRKVTWDRKNVRLQPHDELAYRTIGYLSERKESGLEGRVGVEGAFESELRGQPGRSILQMMSGNKTYVTVEEPVDGNDVITTIDIDFQDIAQNALCRQLKYYEAHAGTAILMEVKTGDIKAIVNLKKTAKGYQEVVNNAIGEAAAPGSVFKAAVVIALLEDGYVQPDDTVDLGNGVYTFYDKSLRESSQKMRGKVTVKEMFACSSNGFSQLVNEHYKKQPEKFINRLYSLQLNKKVGIEILGEGEPYIKYPYEKGWSGLTLPWMSIGYEVKMTPLQVLILYNAIANGGKRMKPRLVKEVRNRGTVVKHFDTEVMDAQICSKRTIRALQEMMEEVVESGTAVNLRGASCPIAGKTGTALVDDGEKGFAVRRYRASFVGYFPADDPLYSCIVVVDQPAVSKGYYGNVVAGNVFREIVDKVYAKASLLYGETPTEEIDTVLPISKNGLKQDFLNIYDELDMEVETGEAAKAEWVMTVREEDGFVLKPRVVKEALVPNVKGMGLRDALYLLENSGLKVGVSGSGTVRSQSVQPGSRLPKGSYVQIELK